MHTILIRSFICLFLGFGLLFIQKADAQSGHFGLEGGVHAAGITGSDFSPDFRAGLLFGVYYRMLLTGTPFYLQPELLYSQQGFRDGDFTVRLNYISPAVLLVYYFAAQAQFEPFVKAGPYIGFNASARTVYGDQTHDIENVNTDFGAIARVGVRVDDRFEAGARVARGFRQTFDQDRNSDRNFLFGFFIGMQL